MPERQDEGCLEQACMQVARLVRRRQHDGHARGMLQVAWCAFVVLREEGQLDGLVYAGLPLTRLPGAGLGLVVVPEDQLNRLELGQVWLDLWLDLGQIWDQQK